MTSMGYECPVCETPQPDAEHLANHLAFTGMLGDEAHETWLDERVPDWAERDPAGLGDALTDHVEAVEIDEIGSGDEHSRRPDVSPAALDADETALDSAAKEALEEARAMTQEMRQPSEEGEDG